VPEEELGFVTSLVVALWAFILGSDPLLYKQKKGKTPPMIWHSQI